MEGGIRPDYEQCIKLAFDSVKNALRCTGAGGSYDSHITWDDDLGAIAQIRGPSDEDLSIESRVGRGVQITAGTDGNFTITVSGDGRLVLSGIQSSAGDPGELLNELYVDTDDSDTLKLSAGP